jgi:alkanesulfonate monooxygenase SsuD/methylene tetrahydromethanopterin reductase-like flavin-dependent oxidoreductase (luciferase family)
MAYTGTFGIHFPIHQPGWVDRTAPAYVDLAGQAEAAGFETVWVNDNFKARHTFSLLAAMAARLSVRPQPDGPGDRPGHDCGALERA